MKPFALYPFMALTQYTDLTVVTQETRGPDVYISRVCLSMEGREVTLIKLIKLKTVLKRTCYVEFVLQTHVILYICISDIDII